MTELDFSFEEPGWISALQPMQGGSITATRFLAMMEGEPEETVEEMVIYML